MAWASLLAVLGTVRAEYREDKQARPSACKFDGEPMSEKNGKLWCPFCGWRPEGR